MWQISVGNDKRSDLVFSGACWLPNWYQAFGRVTPYISCVYILRTGKWWGVFGQTTISSSSRHLTKQQKWAGLKTSGIYLFSIMYHFIIPCSLNQTLVPHRSEFPGLKASPNWVLCDAAGGTQVLPEPPSPRFFRPINVSFLSKQRDCPGPSMCCCCCWSFTCFLHS